MAGDRHRFGHGGFLRRRLTASVARLGPPPGAAEPLGRRGNAEACTLQQRPRLSATIAGCEQGFSRRNGLGTAHFFLPRYAKRRRDVNLGELAGDDAAPDGLRAGRLGDAAQGPARARVHRQAGRRRRRGLRAREQPPHAAVRGRERRLRAARGVARRGSTGRCKKLADFARFAGEEAELTLREIRSTTARAREGHAARESTTATSLVETATGHAHDPARRHRPARLVPKIEWRKAT